jgi:hypothetical protein
MNAARKPRRELGCRQLPLLAETLIALFLVSCQSSTTNRNPTGETFPAVEGSSLKGELVRLPENGRALVLLIGYAQNAQFDADRWLYGLMQADLGVKVIELPTIPGLFPRLISGGIDSGMRSGIPSEDWGSVVTVYGPGAKTIVNFTGDERPRNIRVLLLDPNGRVRWFHDRGFSASKLIELGRAIRDWISGG